MKAAAPSAVSLMDPGAAALALMRMPTLSSSEAGAAAAVAASEVKEAAAAAEAQPIKAPPPRLPPKPARPLEVQVGLIYHLSSAFKRNICNRVLRSERRSGLAYPPLSTRLAVCVDTDFQGCAGRAGQGKSVSLVPS